MEYIFSWPVLVVVVFINLYLMVFVFAVDGDESGFASCFVFVLLYILCFVYFKGGVF